ncbi:peptide MFS transporter [Hirschia baltica]|uniref:Amino acid/peptide transporter n=1 Tax=Hirschia baltica (strain ATCC 49814 / DSM 5838 / IFAM 1418) TaxID=582402 RepID=C6XQV9_HIRBI|nr:peptide MFS transporter [Hirschia baltica]ACT58715.1 amino acid/peptide transporter [Hirschia baltica ATCC 49814]
MTETTIEDSQDKTILGHPRGLFVLFFAEMWERFSYYGMRGLLILYLTQHFLFSDHKSSLIYGAYVSLVYVMGIVGGILADRYLGKRKAIIFGAVLLTIGHFGMAFEGSGSKQIMTYSGAEYELKLDGRGGDAIPYVLSETGRSDISYDEGGSMMVIADSAQVGLPETIAREDYTTSVVQEDLYVNILYLSLAIIIAGVAFLKPNISAIVGDLYGIGDVRRDSGFTIFYMGINLGSFIASFACGILGIVYGWKYGFGLAGIGMLLGLVTFIGFKGWLNGKGEAPSETKLKQSVLGPINVEMLCYASAVIIAILAIWLIKNAEIVAPLMGIVGIVTFIALLAYAFFKLEGGERSGMFAVMYFALAQIPFWSLFEQAASSLNLFTDRLVDRTILGWNVPAPVFQALNAGFIFLFAPLIAWMWIFLAKRKLEPSAPVKFAIGVFLVAVGFLVLVAGMKLTGPGAMTGVLFIFLVYWVHTMGELFISPVGLSATTKMAPLTAAALAMSVWFLYTGLSNSLAGVIATMAGAETIGGQMVDAVTAKATYEAVYTKLAYVGMGIGVAMLAMGPLVKKWMREKEESQIADT